MPAKLYDFAHNQVADWKKAECNMGLQEVTDVFVTLPKIVAKSRNF